MPTKNEMNRKIAEWMGDCWHKAAAQSFDTHNLHWSPDCEECGANTERVRNPDYCSSLDAIRPAEERVVEVFGVAEYGRALNKVVKMPFIQTSAYQNLSNIDKVYGLQAGWVMVDASTRATAICNLIESEKK